MAPQAIRRLVPSEVRRRLHHQLNRVRRPAWLGTLRRTTPLSTIWGHDRGTPIDRVYIESFLSDHRHDIRGRVLEVRDNDYTARFGTRVSRSDVLDIDPGNPCATIRADLEAADAIRSESFDCFILTQTLQYLADVPGSLVHARRILKAGGVLLATVPVVAPIDRLANQPDRWRFPPELCGLLFNAVFGQQHVQVQAYGNVLACIAFMVGMAREELSPDELGSYDPAFPLVAGVRAVKA